MLTRRIVGRVAHLIAPEMFSGLSGLPMDLVDAKNSKMKVTFRGSEELSTHPYQPRRPTVHRNAALGCHCGVGPLRWTRWRVLDVSSLVVVPPYVHRPLSKGRPVRRFSGHLSSLLASS